MFSNSLTLITLNPPFVLNVHHSKFHLIIDKIMTKVSSIIEFV